MRTSLKSTSCVIVFALTVANVTSVLKGLEINKNKTIKDESSLIEPTNYLQNETDVRWNETGKLLLSVF